MPLSGKPVSLPISVRSLVSLRNTSSISVSGVPTHKNPPIMTVAPLSILASASLGVRNFLLITMLLSHKTPTPSTRVNLNQFVAPLPGTYP